MKKKIGLNYLEFFNRKVWNVFTETYWKGTTIIYSIIRLLPKFNNLISQNKEFIVTCRRKIIS